MRRCRPECADGGKGEKMFRLIACGVAIVLLAGCEIKTFDPPTQYGWSGSLVAEPGFENIEGDAGVLLTEGNSGFEASIGITGDEDGAVRAWRIHENTCVDGGDVIGDGSDYPPLVVDATGSATVLTTVSRTVSPTAELHVRVHPSQADLETIIACATLQPVI